MVSNGSQIFSFRPKAQDKPDRLLFFRDFNQLAMDGAIPVGSDADMGSHGPGCVIGQAAI